MPNTIKTAAAQLSPVFLNKTKTVEKACSAIPEAGENGAKLIVFLSDTFQGTLSVYDRYPPVAIDRFEPSVQTPVDGSFQPEDTSYPSTHDGYSVMNITTGSIWLGLHSRIRKNR